MKTRLHFLALCLGLSAALPGAVSTAGAAIVQITSAEFSIAYGATDAGGAVPADGTTWTVTENAGTNTPTTQGQFTFNPSPMGRRFSSTGPVFFDRTLTQEPDTAGDSAGWVGNSDYPFVLTIAANFSGVAPANASATPNYKLVLEISELSIYGSRLPNATTPTTMFWTETTVGHEGTSSSINLLDIGHPYANPALYTQLLWSPDDFEVALASLNDAVTRTFRIIPTHATADNRLIEGLEITGRVHLIYDAVEIPEPSSAALAGLAILGLCVFAARGRKRRQSE